MSFGNSESFNTFERSIVKINSFDGRNVGTGFLVCDDDIICTCYHVVGDQDKRTHHDIQVYFPYSKVSVPCEILKNKDGQECVDPDNDIAFLILSKSDMSELRRNNQKLIAPPLSSESIIFGHPFACMGFRKDEEFPSNLASKGEIRKLTTYKIRDDMEIPVIQLFSTEIVSYE